MPFTTKRSNIPGAGQSIGDADSDVTITMSPSYAYELHSSALRSSSTYFKALLEAAALLINVPSNSPGSKIIKLELVFNGPCVDEPESDPNDCGGFYPQITDDQGKHHRGAVAKLRGPTTAPRGKQLLKQYENVFWSFYRTPVKIRNSSDSKLLLDEIRDLTCIAVSLGAIGSVSANLDGILMKQGQAFFRSIVDKPGDWGDIGLRIQNEAITREAVCHLVGVWNNLEIRRKIENGCSPTLTTLVWKKWRHLDAKRIATEMRVLGFYPATMLLPENEAAKSKKTAPNASQRGHANAARLVSYTKTMVDWMAVNLLRHWLGQHICAGLTRLAVDGGYATYTAISQAGEAYIDQESRDAFLSRFPLSVKARNNFEAALGRIKEELRGYMKGLVEPKCGLDVGKSPVQWLTCTEVAPEEMPWRLEEPASLVTVLPSIDLTGESGRTFVRGINELREPLSMAGTRDVVAGRTPGSLGAGGLDFEIGEKRKLRSRGLPARKAAKRNKNVEEEEEEDDEDEDEMLDLLDDEYGEGFVDESDDGEGPSDDDDFEEGWD